MKQISILLTLLGLISCSQKSVTPTEFKLTMGAIAAQGALEPYSGGGAMVFGKELNSNKAFGKVLTDSNLSQEVPNGTWKFYAIAWEGDGVNGDFTGKPRCAESATVDLTGAEVSVSLNLSNAHCDSNSFHGGQGVITYDPDGPTGDPGYNSFLSPNIVSCNKLPATVSPSESCNYNNLDQTLNMKGHASSYKFALRSFENFDGVMKYQGTNALISGCMRVSESSTSGRQSGMASPTNVNPQNFAIPNLTSFTMNLELHGHFGGKSSTGMIDDCSNDPGFKEMILPRGSMSPGLNYAAHVKDGTDVDIFAVVNGKDVCSDYRVNHTWFPAGHGNEFFPYTVCSIKQFNLLAQYFDDADTNLRTRDKHFRLGKDLNAFYGYTVDLNDPVHPSEADPNRAFLMVGRNDTEGAPAAADAFSGSFNGEDHHIIGMQLRADPNDPSGPSSEIGLFRSLEGAQVSNLKLIAPEVEMDGDDSNLPYHFGILAGQVTNNSVIKNIFIERASVRGGQFVGGIAGLFQSSLMENVIITESSIEGVKGIGGLIGNAQSLSATNNVYQSGVYRSLIESNDHGGKCVAGAPPTTDCQTDYGAEFYEENGTCVSRSISESACTYEWVAGQQVGGIVGTLDMCSGSTDHLKEVVSAQNDIIADSIIGGLVGEMNGTCQIKHSYSTSNVTSTNSLQDPTAGYHARTGGLVGETGSNTISISGSFSSLGAIISEDPSVEYGLILGQGDEGVCEGNTFATESYSAAGATTCTKTLSYVDSRLGSVPGDIGSMIFVNDDPNSDIPRLAWEKPRFCSGKFETSVGLNPSSGKAIGSKENPYVICNREQLASHADKAGKYLHLAYNIDYRGIDVDYAAAADNASPTLEKSLSAHLIGNGHSLSNFIPNAEDGIALFKEIQGSVDDIKVRNFNLFKGSIATRGILAKSNNGKISNSSIIGNVSGLAAIGGIVSSNNGIIEKVYFSGRINPTPNGSSYQNYGGIAAVNRGVIALSESNATIIYTGSYNIANFGGIVGTNDGGSSSAVTYTSPAGFPAPAINVSGKGIIIESEYNGRMGFEPTGYITMVGGIAGSNKNGALISNVYSHLDFGDNTMSGGGGAYGDPYKPRTDQVGAIAGYNNATIEKSYSEFFANFSSEVASEDSANYDIPMNYGPVIGMNDGGSSSANYYQDRVNVSTSEMFYLGLWNVNPSSIQVDQNNANTSLTAFYAGLNIGDYDSPVIWEHEDGNWQPRLKRLEDDMDLNEFLAYINKFNQYH